MPRLILLLPLIAACGGAADTVVADPGADGREPTDSAHTDTALAADAGDRADSADTENPARDARPDATLPGSRFVLPLSVDGRFILDSAGNRVKLAGVNWNGAHEERMVPTGLDTLALDFIAARIRALGFNSVRLTWSNEMVETDPVVDPATVAANPQLIGLTALEVFDAVIDALQQQGLLIVLNNHMSDAGWCCSLNDDNSLWYNDRYPESAWIADWVKLAARYADRPAVIAADLRNEPRFPAAWGDALGPDFDWPAAAARCAAEILVVNPDLLIVVEGTDFATHLQGAAALPVQLPLPGRLVYSAHDYPWFHSPPQTYEQLAAQLDQAWGYLLEEGHPWTAPVWVGEFGICNDCLDDPWFDSFIKYLRERDADWSWWLLFGTGDWGLLNPADGSPWSGELLHHLRGLIAPSGE